jgi:hypothetical protein
VLKRNLQKSPLESSCVVVAHIANYSILKYLKISPEKSHISRFDTVVANEMYVHYKRGIITILRALDKSRENGTPKTLSATIVYLSTTSVVCNTIHEPPNKQSTS